jgi:hypothetical protein
MSDERANATQANAAAMFEVLIGEIRELRGAVAALSPQHSDALVDAEAVAMALGTARGWVYAHADALGVTRLGDGSRPRLRFDLEVARARFACLTDERSQSATGQSPRAVSTLRASGGGGGRRSSAKRLPQAGSVLRVRPREAA